MKIADEIKSLVEANSGIISDQDLKKFWSKMKEEVFKQSPEVKKNDLGLFFDGTSVEFKGIPVENDGSLGSDFVKNPQDYIIGKLELKAIEPSDLISQILNEVLDHESTVEEDQEALEYFIKHIKGETVYFYGESEYEYNEVISFEGTTKIKAVKWDSQKLELVVTDHDIVKMEVELE